MRVKAVELMDADADLVSIVDRGANRRGWKIMKRAGNGDLTPEKQSMIRKAVGYIGTFVDMLRGLDSKHPLLAKFDEGDRPALDMTVREQVERSTGKTPVVLTFDTSSWDTDAAVKYADENGFASDSIVATDKAIRLWQVEKGEPESGIDFDTVNEDMPEGVACVVAKFGATGGMHKPAGGAPHNPPAGGKPAPHNPGSGGAPAPKNPGGSTKSAPHNPTGKAGAPHNPTPGGKTANDGKAIRYMPSLPMAASSIAYVSRHAKATTCKDATLLPGAAGLADACNLLLSVIANGGDATAELSAFGELVSSVKVDDTMKTELIGRAKAAEMLTQMPAEGFAAVGGGVPIELEFTTPLEGGQEESMTKEQEAKLDALAAAVDPAKLGETITSIVEKAVATKLGLKPEDKGDEGKGKETTDKDADGKIAALSAKVDALPELIAKGVEKALGDLPSNVQKVIKAATGSRSARLSDTPESVAASSTGLFDSAFPPAYRRRAAS